MHDITGIEGELRPYRLTAGNRFCIVGVILYKWRCAMTAVRQIVDSSTTAQEPRNIDPSRPMIALTFDDGPAKNHTPRIIDVFEAYGGRATFFVVGNRVSRYSALITRMHASGFEVVGHSWDHADLTQLSDSQIRMQILDTHNAIAEIVGELPPIFRAPYGAINQTVSKAAIDAGFSFIGWNVDPGDWDVKNADVVPSRVLNDARDGAIVVLHDFHEPTARAAEQIVPELVARGYQLVTVSELFRYRKVILEPGIVYNGAPPQV